MAEVVIRPAQHEDVPELAGRLRPADLAEIQACGFDDPVRALRLTLRNSTHAWTATADGQVVCMLGVGALSVLCGEGSPWLMGTSAMRGRSVMRNTGPYIAAMLRAYPVLRNHVHARNTTAVAWLRRIGFTVRDAEPYGPRGEMFHPFEMRA